MTYKVFYGPNAVHLEKVNPGVSQVSGQPNVKEFDNESEAVAFVDSLDSTFFSSWEKDNNYFTDQYVRVGQKIFKLIEDVSPMDFYVSPFEPEETKISPATLTSKFQLIYEKESN